MTDALFLGEFVKEPEPYKMYYLNSPALDKDRFGGFAVADPEKPLPAHLLRASSKVCPHSGEVSFWLDRHMILRYTPCGAWVDTWDGEKFVNLRAGKQWASTTEAEAIDQLWWRKVTQVRILQARLDDAKAAHDVLQKHFGKKHKPARPRFMGGYDSDYY